MSLPRLRIKKREQQRLRDGHLWVYSNEVDIEHTPLRNIKSHLVHLEDYRGHFLATASFNGQALICARILDTSARDTLDQAFFAGKLRQALALRDMVFTQPYYRLVYGEGDFLAGVVIDRFNDCVVVQISTQAIESAKNELIAALYEVLGSHIAILLKNDGKGRQIEQLPEYIEWVGSPRDQLEVVENGVRFAAPIDGQKTGWFYDHRLGRAWLNSIAQDRRVLDVFSYIGGWGVQAAAHGASHVVCTDVSAKAGQAVLDNAARNGLTQVSFVESDAFAYLKQPVNEHYDVVVLDPPALIQKRRDFEQGRQAYFSLNEGALARVADGGIFITASCSLHMQRDELIKIVQQVARRQQKHVQLIHEAHPAADHPQLLAMPEAAYLKCLMFRVQCINTATKSV